MSKNDTLKNIFDEIDLLTKEKIRDIEGSKSITLVVFGMLANPVHLTMHGGIRYHATIREVKPQSTDLLHTPVDTSYMNYFSNFIYDKSNAHKINDFLRNVSDLAKCMSKSNKNVGTNYALLDKYEYHSIYSNSTKIYKPSVVKLFQDLGLEYYEIDRKDEIYKLSVVNGKIKEEMVLSHRDINAIANECKQNIKFEYNKIKDICKIDCNLD